MVVLGSVRKGAGMIVFLFRLFLRGEVGYFVCWAGKLKGVRF